MNLTKSISAAKENPRRIDLLVSSVADRILRGRPEEVTLAYLDDLLADHSELVRDTARFCVACVPFLQGAVETVEHNESYNLATDEHIRKWISGLAWAIITSAQCGIPATGIHVWLDTGYEDATQSSTWISFQFGEVKVERRNWQGAIWQCNFDAAVAPAAPEDQANGFWDLRYMSWRSECFQEGIDNNSS